MNTVGLDNEAVRDVYADWLETNATTQDSDISAMMINMATHDRALVTNWTGGESPTDLDEAYDLGWGLWDGLCATPHPDIYDVELAEVARGYLEQESGTSLQ